MADFVCVGDVSQDNFFFIDEEIKYGQKIPVERFGTACGGNAANVAVGLTRLGIHTSLVTAFGGDDRGVWLKRELLKNNVDLENSWVEEKKESNISSIIIFRKERTIFSYHTPGQTKKIPSARWIFLSTVHEGVLEKLGGAKLAFNPSAADLRQSQDFLRPVVERSEVLIVNKEEMDVLGMKGPKITVVTDGMNGARAFSEQKEYFCLPFPSEILETTGAGDAFTTGFLAAIFNGQEISEAMRWGMAEAASVVSKLGAQEGLLTMDKLTASLQKKA